MKRHLGAPLLVILAALLVAGGCSADSQTDEIVLLTHASFALSEGTLESFTQQTGVTVKLQISGDAGTMVNQAILTKDNPIADVLYGVDNTFLSRAIDSGIFLPYTAVGLENVSTLLRVDGDIVTPIDFGDVCVNYDIAALASISVAPPESLEDLLDPLYADMLVVEDPATSSPGLAFLMATIAAYPDGAEYDWKAFWTDLFANGAVIATDWSEAYYTRFTRSGGEQPLVVSYASSPPAEVFFGELAEAPTAVMPEGCFRQIEYAGILSGTDHESDARKLIDFLLSVPVQEDIPLNMFVYPANDLAALPQVFSDFTTFPEDSVVMEPGRIEENREQWIREWTAIARS
jgi:thiamine transport system substrate-binding protein